MSLAFGAVFAAALTLAAEPRRPSDSVVVAPIVVRGELSAQAGDKLRKRLLEGLERARVSVVAHEAERALGECDDACVVELAGSVGATHVLRLTLEVEGRDYGTHAELLDATRAGLVAHANRRCEICGLEEVGELVAADAASLGQQLALLEKPSILAIHTRPPGAVVRVDGKSRGITPLDLELPAGRHKIDVALDGHFASEREIVLVEGVDQDVELVLQRVPPERRARAPMVVGATLLSLGIGGAATGAALLAIHRRPVQNRCHGDAIDVTGLCRWRYDTLAGGVVLVGIGAAALVTGIVLVARERKRGAARESRHAARGRLEPWLASPGLVGSF